MITVNYIIKDLQGIHARPAGLLVKLAASYKSDITLQSGEKSVNMKKLLALMSLGIKKDTQISITLEGEDENEAAKAIEIFLNENL